MTLDQKPEPAAVNVAPDVACTPTGPRAPGPPANSILGSRVGRWAMRAAVIVVILLALAHNLHLTWQRWGDLIYDSGRELDTPRQLLAGKILYKDVRYWYGPLAPYTNAGLYRIFGVRLSTLTTAGIVSAALLAWLMYRLVRLFAGRAAATATAVAFLYICGFAEYYAFNHLNFALPYAYPATYGILLATASVHFLLRHTRHGRAADFLLSCLFLGLTSLCKVEVLFAAGAAHAVFLVGSLGARRLNRPMYALGYLGAIAIPVCVYAGFYAAAGSALWRENLFLPGNVAASAYTLEHFGLAEPMKSLKELGLSTAGMLGCLAALWCGILAEDRIRRDPTYDASMRALATGAIGLAAGLLCGGICYLLGAFDMFRALPILLLIGFGVFAVRWVMGREDRAGRVPWMILFAFGLAALARMALKCGAEHYGFYLLVPGLMGFAVFWCRLVPKWLTSARNDRGAPRSPAAAGPAGARPVASPTAPSRGVSGYVCGLAMLAATTWSHAALTQETMQMVFGSENLTRITTPRGTMICPAMYKGTVDKAVEFLAAQPPGTKVVVMPEGSGITFLAGCTNPLGVHTFLPIDFSGAYREAAMVKRLTEASPDFIVLVPRSVEEYGKKAFGDDYAKPVFNWVQANYRPVKPFRTRAYQVLVLGRRGTATITSQPTP